LILKELNIKPKNTPASYYLTQYCIKLGLSVEFQASAKNLLKMISKSGTNENSSPRNFAVAAIYVTSKTLRREKRIKQQTLAEISNVSEVTIRKYIKVLRKFLDSES
jgi:transcription initiation factor TFIIIB Brf1 subunit/transcription initiation factor TFIIB